jgi:hypothetical protein
MRFLNHFAYATIILVFLLTLVLTSTIAIRFGPIGADYNAHLRIAQRYAHGEFALIDKDIISENKTPYPPFFHLLLAGGILTHTIKPLEFILQLLIYPLALFAPTYLMYKTKGVLPATLVLLLLFGSLALFDRGQVAPQAFDLILFPFAILAFLSNRTTLMIFLLVIMVYTHGAYSLLLFGGLLAYGIHKKKHARQLLLTLILCAPIIILTLAYLPAALSTSIGANTPQEALIQNNLLYFFTYLSIPISLLFIVGLISRGKDSLATLVLFWIIALLPLVIFFPDRFASYVSVPLALIIGIAFDHHRKELAPYTIPLFIILLVLGFATSFLFWMRSTIGTSPFLFQT